MFRLFLMSFDYETNCMTIYAVVFFKKYKFTGKTINTAMQFKIFCRFFAFIRFFINLTSIFVKY